MNAGKYFAENLDKFPSFFVNLQHAGGYNPTLTSIMPAITRQALVYRVAPHQDDDRLITVLETAAAFMFTAPQFLPSNDVNFD